MDELSIENFAQFSKTEASNNQSGDRQPTVGQSALALQRLIVLNFETHTDATPSIVNQNAQMLPVFLQHLQFLLASHR